MGDFLKRARVYSRTRHFKLAFTAITVAIVAIGPKVTEHFPYLSFVTAGMRMMATLWLWDIPM